MSIARMIVSAALEGWNIASTVYVQNFSVAAQEGSVQAVHFRSDGLKMYIVGSLGDAVYEYDLSAAWDVSTASYVQNFSIAAQETNPRGLFFKDDGTAMYILGSSSQNVIGYSLSSAWDISTATFAVSDSLGVSVSTGLFFKPDGTRMYTTTTTGPAVREYSLSTPWSVGTVSLVRLFDVSAQESSPQDVFFKPDGTKMYIVGATGDAVYEYGLSTAWDISTASYFQSVSVAAQESSPTGLFFRPNGLRMYTTGSSGDAVYEYRL